MKKLLVLAAFLVSMVCIIMFVIPTKQSELPFKADGTPKVSVEKAVKDYFEGLTKPREVVVYEVSMDAETYKRMNADKLAGKRIDIQPVLDERSLYQRMMGR